MRKPHLPDWVEYVWSELTKPPAFIKQEKESALPSEPAAQTPPETDDVSPRIEEWRRVLKPSIRSFKRWIEAPPRLQTPSWTVATGRPRRVPRTRLHRRRRKRKAAFAGAKRRRSGQRQLRRARFRTATRARRRARPPRSHPTRSAHPANVGALRSSSFAAPIVAADSGRGPAATEDTNPTAEGAAAPRAAGADLRSATNDGERATCAWLRALFSAQAVDLTPAHGVLRVEMRDGSVYLATVTALPTQRIEFIAQAVDALRAHGFALAPRVLRTTAGIAYAPRGGVRYVASEWLRGEAADLGATVSCARAARTLALLNACSRSWRIEPYEPPSQHDIQTLLKGRLRELVHIRDTLLLADEPDTFDAVAKIHLPAAIADAQAALLLLGQAALSGDTGVNEDQCGLCHLNVTSRNLIERPDGTIACTHLDMMARAPRALDLAHLLRRSMQAIGAYTDAPAAAALAEYKQVAPWADTDTLLLQALLTFPHRFWRLLRSYYELAAPTDADRAHGLRRLRACVALDRSRRSWIQRLPDLTH
ncbi:MAG: hypothetical protein OWT27_00340 [Firmicutes bacterium]|nr:hypothetical protein [Bacillota bacterium]